MKLKCERVRGVRDVKGVRGVRGVKGEPQCVGGDRLRNGGEVSSGMHGTLTL